MYKAVTLAGGIREPLLTCSSFPSGTNTKLWFKVSQYLNNLGYVFHFMEFLLRSCSGKEENFHLKIFSSLEFLSYLSCLRLYS